MCYTHRRQYKACIKIYQRLYIKSKQYDDSSKFNGITFRDIIQLKTYQWSISKSSVEHILSNDYKVG